jgi:hypothetical protein
MLASSQHTCDPIARLSGAHFIPVPPYIMLQHCSQTLSTVGYGSRSPTCAWSEVISAVECVSARCGSQLAWQVSSWCVGVLLCHCCTSEWLVCSASLSLSLSLSLTPPHPPPPHTLSLTHTHPLSLTHTLFLCGCLILVAFFVCARGAGGGAGVDFKSTCQLMVDGTGVRAYLRGVDNRSPLRPVHTTNLENLAV